MKGGASWVRREGAGRPWRGVTGLRAPRPARAGVSLPGGSVDRRAGRAEHRREADPGGPLKAEKVAARRLKWKPSLAVSVTPGGVVCRGLPASAPPQGKTSSTARGCDLRKPGDPEKAPVGTLSISGWPRL